MPSPPPTPVPDPPQITCPASVTQVSPNAQPVTLVFGTPSVINGAAPVTTSCTPVSGSAFNLGTTTVTCTATDARSRVATCTFPIVVQRPAQISATNFMAFGDSITRGEDGVNATLTWLPTDYPTPMSFPQVINLDLSYPTKLQQQLSARYTTQAMTVANLGEPGEYAATPEALSRFRANVGTRRYQVVLIMEGSNDIFTGDPNQIGPAIANLRTMIQYAKSLSVRPYLATVPPMNPAGPRGRLGYATVAPLNTALRGLASSESVTLVDVNAAFAGDLSLIGSDGLHPNANGFERIATAFFDAIKATLETSAPGRVPLPFSSTFP